MKNFVKFFGMIALIAVVGFALVGCDNGNGGGGEGPKTLVIKDIPESIRQISYPASGSIGIIPVGLSQEELQELYDNPPDSAPGALFNNYDITVSGSGPYTVTFPLYSGYDRRWTGSGTYDVVYGCSSTGPFYFIRSVTFSSGTTTVSWDDAELVTLE